MDKETQLQHEFENLRSEIRAADSLNYQIMGIVVAAVAALLATGFKETDPLNRLFIFLCIYVITIPGYRILRGNRRRTWRISTYIRVFLEPQLAYANWETRLDMHRQAAEAKNKRQSIGSLINRNEWFIITALNTLAALATIFHVLLQAALYPTTKIGSVVAVLVFYAMLFFLTLYQEKQLGRSGAVEKECLARWREIRDAEQKTNEK